MYDHWMKTLMSTISLSPKINRNYNWKKNQTVLIEEINSIYTLWYYKIYKKDLNE